VAEPEIIIITGSHRYLDDFTHCDKNYITNVHNLQPAGIYYTTFYRTGISIIN
jgi:hypothetical protein